jgi:arginine decarboxylase
MGYLDLGGGLAVDYMGGRAMHVHSCNYTLDDYCQAIVGTVAEALDPLDITHPNLVTESGRATVAYSSLLLFNILDVMRFEPISLPQQLEEHSPEALKKLFAMHNRCSADQPEENYAEALACRDRIRDLFRSGEVSLRQRSAAENLFLAVSRGILDSLTGKEALPESLADLKLSLSDIYYGNFSVFQSLPDTWAIGQVFPVMPLHRHTERPGRAATLSDLTCDCDGKLDRFFVRDGEQDTLPVHSLREGEEYLLGVFLMGAYQETLGDLHNLFGDTHVASVRINLDGSFDVLKEINGDTIGDVLEMVEYRSDLLFETFRARAEDAVRTGRISVRERQTMVEEYAANLRGYTYYER